MRPRLPQRLDRRRLVQITELFNSPLDGEKLAAVSAADRILKAAGTSWRELITPPEEPAADTSTLDNGGADRPDVRSMSYAELAQHGRGALTDWELQFLVGCSGIRRLSPKQVRMIREIRSKVATAIAARAAADDPAMSA